eukprot:TRINITY_DN67071_c1_g8_i1.p1 TRINITY_DN67071_c1_g8~~TRINITY_DN67071_c1_g8_i1.p1  ORF type:complete len:291 (-),score=8.40 TRINITY_DN67071_c1_g8_i1:122-898(-)
MQGEFGIIVRAVSDAFTLANDLHTADPTTTYAFSISMIEIYNEAAHDLLPSPTEEHRPYCKPLRRLRFRNTLDSGVQCKPDPVRAVSDLNEVQCLLAEGKQHMVVDGSAHVIVTLQINRTVMRPGVETSTKRSEIHFVDLAGSEKIQRNSPDNTQVFKKKLINMGLEQLVGVILSLLKKHKYTWHRQSQLTYFLQHCLTSKSIITAIFQISPFDREESVCTLSVADALNSAVLDEGDSTLEQVKQLFPPLGHGKFYSG